MFRSYLLIFIIAAVLGTLYDWIHVAFGVLRYSQEHFAGTNLWVPLEFGVAGVVGAAAARYIASHVSAPKITRKRILFDAALLLVAYLTTGVFLGKDDVTFAALMAIALLSVASRVHKLVYIGSAFAAVAGPAGEYLMSRSGFFHYTRAPTIPAWLPLLWIVAAGAFIDAAVIMASPVEGKRRSRAAERPPHIRD